MHSLISKCTLAALALSSCTVNGQSVLSEVGIVQRAAFDPFQSKLANGNVSLAARDDVDPGLELRILPLGSSITYGTGSTDGNGYRLNLLKLLSGSKVEYIGSVRNGEMADNYNEGHPGYTINLMEGQAKKSLPQRPNIILLHEGTNDLNKDHAETEPSVLGAPDRLGDLIDFVIEACPDATLIVAQIVLSSDPIVTRKIKKFNSALPAVIAQRRNAGHHVLLVDMSSIDSSYLVSDGIHPSDFGYQKMANFWYQGIKNIPSGWLKAPVSPDPHPYIPDDAPGHPGCIAGRDISTIETRSSKSGHHCLGLPVWTSLGRISHGVGSNGDAVFHQNWYNRGKMALGVGHDGLNVLFADLRGTGKSDYIWINPKTYAMNAWLSDGVDPHFKFTEAANPISKAGCHIDHLRLPDLTGSGRADYVCIDVKTGTTNVWWNQWTQAGGFKWDGPHKLAGPVGGGNINSIFYMDINGDSRDDLVVRGAQGDLHGWLNLGKKYSNAVQWIDVGVIASATKTPSGATTPNTTFADLNNDGRDDILVWNNFGGLSGYLNVRGLEEGKPIWVHQDNIANGQGILPHDIRISDVTGNGWADYILVNNKNGACTLFANNGAVDVSRIGDATWVADMNGDGLDDKILIDENGKANVWINGQSNPKAHYGWNFYGQGGPIAMGVGAKREYIRLADVDGDGRADYLTINENTGAVSCYINLGPNKAWTWKDVGVISPGRGDSIGVHFADVTGDGKADLIFLDIFSHMTVYRNDYGGGNNWAWTKLNDVPIDFNTGFRRDMRFADIDGDQKADAIWLHPQDASGVIWLNKDPTNRAGWQRASHFPLNQIPGVRVAAANIQFGRLNTPYGRNDYIETDPSDGAWTIWRNDCEKLEGGSNDAHPQSISSEKVGSASSGSAVCGAVGAGATGSASASAGSGGGSESSPAPTEGSPTATGGSHTTAGGSPASTGNVIIFGGSAYTEDSNSQFVIAGQTLKPGGAITISGTLISLAPGANEAVIAGSTEMLSPSNTVGVGNNPGNTEVITVAGSTYTGSPGTGFVLNGQTLTPGGQITIDNTVVSLLEGGTIAVVGGSTANLAAPITSSAGGVLAPPTSSAGGVHEPPTSSAGGVVAPPTSSAGGVHEPPTSSAGGVVAPPTSSAGGVVAPPTSSAGGVLAPPTSSSGGVLAPPTSSSGSSGNGYGITIPSFTTIVSANPISGFDHTRGANAIDALKSTARSGLSLFESGLSGLKGLSTSGGSDGFPSADALRGPLTQLTHASQSFGSVTQSLEEIELTDVNSQDLWLRIQAVDTEVSTFRNNYNSVLNDLWTHRRKFATLVGILGAAGFVNSITNLINFNANIGPASNPAKTSAASTTSQSQCSQTTVTDYWVLCASGSTLSCTTTSSSLASGCSASASTTTDTCPLVTDDPNDDQGEDGNPNTTPTPSSTSTSGPSLSPVPFQSSEVQSISSKESSIPASSTSSHLPPATPSLIPTDFYTGYFEEKSGVGNIGGPESPSISFWAIYAVPPGTHHDACADNPVFRDPTEQPIEDYPISKGPFNAAGTTCTYDRNSADENGRIFCNGIIVQCRKDTNGHAHLCNTPKQGASASWVPEEIGSITG